MHRECRECFPSFNKDCAAGNIPYGHTLRLNKMAISPMMLSKEYARKRCSWLEIEMYLFLRFQWQTNDIISGCSAPNLCHWHRITSLSHNESKLKCNISVYILMSFLKILLNCLIGYRWTQYNTTAQCAWGKCKFGSNEIGRWLCSEQMTRLLIQQGKNPNKYEVVANCA